MHKPLWIMVRQIDTTQKYTAILLTFELKLGLSVLSKYMKQGGAQMQSRVPFLCTTQSTLQHCRIINLMQ